MNLPRTHSILRQRPHLKQPPRHKILASVYAALAVILLTCYVPALCDADQLRDGNPARRTQRRHEAKYQPSEPAPLQAPPAESGPKVNEEAHHFDQTPRPDAAVESPSSALSSLFSYTRQFGIERYIKRIASLGLEYAANVEDLMHIDNLANGLEYQGLNLDGPRASVEIVDFQPRKDDNGLIHGAGTIASSWQNGSVVHKLPFNAPLVPKSALEEQLRLIKLIDASSTPAFYLNQTAPTVRDLPLHPRP